MTTIWEKNYQKLCDYKNQHGDTNVPKNYHDTKLARLVISLRQQKRNNTLKPERELALLQLGFDFEPHETKWHGNYQSMVEYYRLNGHSSPNRRSENEHERTLAEWVHRMHKLVRQNELDEDKVTKLAMINIDGKPSEYHLNKQELPEKFAKYIARLQDHIDKHGTDITNNIVDRELYDWLVLQHKRIQASMITPREYAALLRSNFTLALETSANVIPFQRKSA